MLLDTAEAARSFPRGDLALARCPGCDFVTNVAFDAEAMRYGEGYENVQVCSEFFEHYVDTLVDRLVEQGVRGKRVVEVGCGTGYFLTKLCERGGNTGTGFDTVYAGPEGPAPGLRFVRDFYGPRYADVPADVVVCRHTIEHTPDPLALLTSVRDALAQTDDALVVFETPALEWILEHVVFQDLFYEHCSYFSGPSLAFAMRRAGFRPTVVDRVFGGQYLWVEAALAEAAAADPPGGVLRPAVDRYAAEEAARLGLADERMGALAEAGPLAVWGAGAKGATFLNLLDPGADRVVAVVDVNPNKAGKFVPGTGHPIVGPEALRRLGVRTVLLMNPNYLEECRRLAADHGADVTFLTQETGWA